jgi:YegS/Rv2252/BmrU family lipid kinase
MMSGKRFFLVVNPQGGIRQGLSVLEQVRPIFAAAGAVLDVHVSQFPGHVAELARTVDLCGCDGFCLIGGDGTIHEAVNGLLQRGEPAPVPIGIIPGGTGNSVALHLGYASPEEAVGRILSGATQPVDVAKLTWADETVYCANIVGWGSVVDISQTAERWRRLGRSRYNLATLWHILRAARRRARIILDDQTIEDEVLFLLACNTRFTGKAMLVAPRAELADGKIDVLLVRRASRLQVLRLFQGIFDGSHLALPAVEFYQVQSFRIETETPDLLNLDGELKRHTPVSAEMIPGALRVFT